ncbi:MAG: bifunctional 5,10-methylenetetrahydrofolate dehydrogenase/5,10-methenyltetrahydrofolate cyclohydrolase [Acidobacteriota bacterium]
MAAEILDGKRIAEDIKAEVAREVQELTRGGARKPKLVAVLVGENPGSQVYVRSKTKTAASLGIDSETLRLPAETTAAALLDEVARLNADHSVDGILVQLPLPPQIDADRVLERIDVAKDVDGFHPISIGRLTLGQPCLPPCTPAGIIEILRRNGVEIAGARACVLGRSRIVGKPVASLLLNAHATITVCHSKTRDIASAVREADIVVAAIGRAGFVTGGMVRPGAAVIDVGINELRSLEELRRFHDGGELARRTAEIAEKGRTLVGDVEFKSVQAVAGKITPVPGGVGPLTIAMLMRNVVAARRSRGA